MLLTTIYVRTPLEFSIFPSLLLATTLFRLVLNVATTRLILTRAGSDGLLAAGGVVEDLRRVRGRRPDRGRADHLRHHRGDPVRGDHQGGHADQRSGGPLRLGRHAGPADGHRRRPERRASSTSARPSAAASEITQQADFFGAMDGASKFVRGDAIAGIVITLINIIGGLFIGVIEGGHEPRPGRLAVHQADHRRRPGEPGAGLPDLAGRRLAGHAQQLRDRPARRVPQAALLASAGPGRGGRASWAS